MFAEVSRKNALTLADAYARATGDSLTKVSAQFYGNGIFFRDLANRDRSISVERFGEMLAKFAAKWPRGEPWPDLQPIYFTKENLSQGRHVTNLKRHKSR